MVADASKVTCCPTQAGFSEALILTETGADGRTDITIGVDITWLVLGQMAFDVNVQEI